MELLSEHFDLSIRQTCLGGDATIEYIFSERLFFGTSNICLKIGRLEFLRFII